MHLRGYVEPHSCQHCAEVVLARDYGGCEAIFERQRQRRERTAQRLGGDFNGISEDRKHVMQQVRRRLEQYFLFDDSEECFQRYAAEGCSLYGMIATGLREPRRRLLERNADVVVAAQFHHGDSLQIGLLDIRHRLAPDEDWNFFRFHLTDIAGGRFVALTEVDDPAAEHVECRPPNILPSAKESYAQVDKWYQECLAEHTACRMSRSDFMPTRLVKIWRMNGRRVLQLQDGVPSAPYATLSYCWGDNQDVKTTKDTIRRHFTRINFSDLPKTIQDAVEIAEKLNIQYIWVDSLCIIQDDDMDRSIEISGMSDIYSCASVTISATAATQVQEGFLQDRLPLGHESPDRVFSLRYMCSDGQIGTVIIVPDPRTPEEPLYKRGWAFQERLLSTRVVEYRGNQIHWRCHSRRHVDGWRKPSVFGELLWDASAGRLSTIREDDQEQTMTRHEGWYKLVENYTKLALKFPDDRLPAIAGFAERIGRQSSDEYIAGIWRSSLPTSLLWSVSYGRSLRLQHAPSWSWASVTGIVRFSQRTGLVDALEVLGVQYKLRDKGAKFDQVAFAHLQVRGRVRMAMWDPVAEARGSIKIDLEGSESSERRSIRPDMDTTEDVESTRFAIYLLEAARETRNSFCLILRKCPDGLYRRLGTVAYVPLESFEVASSVTLTIK